MPHTQGKWTASWNTVTTSLNLQVTANENRICNFPEPHYANGKNGIVSENESLANAWLIACAPEMLAMLEHFYYGVRYEQDLTTNKLGKLIIKARTGEDLK